MRKTWLHGVSLMLDLALTGTADWAANCEDTTGPGGTRVACSCGGTVTTNTKLKAADPVVSTGPADTCSGDGLVIGASNITLDCAKFALRGDDTGEGVVVSGTAGVTVKRCTISGFDTGIAVEYSTEFTVDNNTVQNSEVGIGLFATSSNTVKNNKVSNTFAGVGLVGDNVSQANVLTNNQVEDSFLGIAVVEAATHNTITDNRAKNNFVGLLVGFFDSDGSDNNVVAGNRAEQN